VIVVAILVVAVVEPCWTSYSMWNWKARLKYIWC